MKQALITNLVELAISKKIITNEEKDIYTYGCNQIISSALGVAISLIIGFAMKMTIPSIIYTLSYMTLRQYAGGYHEATQIRCYILSSIIEILALIGIKLTYQSPPICLIVLVISNIIIWKLSPVEAINKPLDKKEKQEFRKRTIKTILLQNIIIAILYQLKQSICLTSIIAAIASVSIMLVIPPKQQK